jgi:hypothetical protein
MFFLSYQMFLTNNSRLKPHKEQKLNEIEEAIFKGSPRVKVSKYNEFTVK